MEKYSISYSKTSKATILEDSHFIYDIIPWDTLESKKAIVRLLNEKEKRLDELEKENKYLKEYVEELEVHVPKETLKQIKEVLH